MEWAKLIFYDFGIGTFSLLFAFSLVVLGIKRKKEFTKKILFNCSAIFVALFLFELYHFLQKEHNHVNFGGTYKGNSFVSGYKKDVGFGPYDDTTMVVSAIKLKNDTVVYDVNYTLKKGKRFIPNNNDSSKKSMYFLGCSFIFGDGLNDKQTLPYFFNEYSEHKFNSINYAFSGYGTHQVLKIVETKLKREVEDSSVAIYLLLPSHLDRAAGYVDWDKFGPKYEVENNSLIYKGAFDEKTSLNDNYIVDKLKSSWKKSALYATFLKPKLTDKDALRVLEIIKTIHSSLREKNIRFILLIQTSESTESEKVIYGDLEKIIYDNLSKTNIEHYYIDSIIPDFRHNYKKYKIKGDGHPNENYNRELGKFLAKKLRNK
ncbi:MAG: hypothetical protein ACLGGV_04575 [Bacteroidia bacterium]